MTQAIPGLLGPAKGYTDLLDEALLKRQETDNARFKEKSPLRPSAAGYCGRKLAYDFNEFRGNAKYDPEVKSPATIRLLNLGHSIEWSALKNFGAVEGLEVRYRQQSLSFFPLAEGAQPTEGSIDFVMYFKDHRAVGDVKSKGDKYSSWFSSKWDETDEKLSKMASVKVISETAYWVEDLPAFLRELNDPFFSDNFIQLNLYACNPFLRERGVDHAFIYQYNKNDSRHREVRFKPSDEVYNYVKDKFLAIARAVDEHKDPTLVEKEYGLGSIRCAFCQYKDLCWPGTDAKKEYFATWPKKQWPKDTDRLASGNELETLYANFVQAKEAGDEADKLEHELCKLLEREQVQKVRFQDGNVYDLKFLKSPKPHFALKRGKV